MNRSPSKAIHPHCPYLLPTPSSTPLGAGPSLENASHRRIPRPLLRPQSVPPAPCARPESTPSRPVSAHHEPPLQPASPPPASRSRHRSLHPPRLSGGSASLRTVPGAVSFTSETPQDHAGQSSPAPECSQRTPDPARHSEAPSAQTAGRASRSPCWMSPLLPPGMGTLSWRSGSGRQRRQKE